MLLLCAVPGLAVLASGSGCHRSPARAEALHEATASPSDRRNVSARGPGALYALSPEESSAVDRFLRDHPALRVATDDDRAALRDGERDMGRLYGVYHPYFVRGDVNDDGVMDFVLAFVQRRPHGAKRFSVVVFSGRAATDGGPAYEPGAFIEQDVALARGDVAVDRDAVLVTPDVAEDDVRRYRWNPADRSYVLVEDSDEDDPARPEVSET
jgi:hypothetical protein